MISVNRVGIALLAAALTITAAIPLAQVVVPTKGAPPGPRTGLIVGQVVDEAGAPVAEAIVQLTMPRYLPELATTPKGRVMADAEGRFFFSDLPAGDYALRASKEGYGGGGYEQRRATASNQLFTLVEGERRTDAKLTLWKFAVIGGTVLDEAGEPVIGVTVQALVPNTVAGRPAFNSGGTANLNPDATTDDRGIFRLSRLVPGRYIITVRSTLTTMPVGLLSAANADTALRNELAMTTAEIAPLGQPRTQQFGEFALLTLNRVALPPPPTPAGRMQVYRTTYFPTATTASAASLITVAAGEERADLVIRLRPVPAIRISGRLVTPDGSAPPPTSLRLVGEAAAGVGDEGFETVTALSDASGRFTLLGVPAGEYVLKHASMLALFALQGRQGWWIAQPISAGTSDIDNLVVNVRPALRVEGRLEFRPESASPPPIPISPGVSFDVPDGGSGRFSGQMSSRTGLTFRTVAAGGRYIVRPFESGGWFVKSVTLDGRDITDVPFTLESDATTFVVTYTDRTSKITGLVKDARGAVSTPSVVLAFPVDQQRWVGYGWSPRNLKRATVSRAGVYSLEGLPAGDYYLIAVDDADTEDWTDPKTLALLSRQASKVSIAAADEKTLDLTVKAIR